MALEVSRSKRLHIGPQTTTFEVTHKKPVEHISNMTEILLERTALYLVRYVMMNGIHRLRPTFQ